MSNIQIQILSVSKVQATTKTGKPYDKADVAYKNLTFGNKVEGKVVMPFGSTASACTTLLNAQSGQVYDITVVKNAQGYNDWTEAKIANGGTGLAFPVAAPAPSFGGGGAPARAGNNFPTTEERAKTQVYIVRQSAVKAAVDALSVGAKTPPNTASVIAYAKELEAYVFGGSTEIPNPGFNLEVPKEDDEADVPY